MLLLLLDQADGSALREFGGLTVAALGGLAGVRVVRFDGPGPGLDVPALRARAGLLVQQCGALRRLAVHPLLGRAKLLRKHQASVPTVGGIRSVVRTTSTGPLVRGRGLSGSPPPVLPVGRLGVRG